MLITIAHAQESVALAQSFVDRVSVAIIIPLIQLMMGVALIVFIWGGFEYVRGANDPTARQQGRRNLIWGLVGFLVMVSAYAILSVASNTVGVSPDDYIFIDERVVPQP